MSRHAPLLLGLLFAAGLTVGPSAGEPALAAQAPGAESTQEPPAAARPIDREPHKGRRKQAHPDRNAGTGSVPTAGARTGDPSGLRMSGFGGQGFGGEGKARRIGGFGFGGRNFGAQGFRRRGLGGRNRGRGYGGYTGSGGGYNPAGGNPPAEGSRNGQGGRRAGSKSTTDLASEVEAL